MLGLRVISLVPSVTETMISWGINPIACTRFCKQNLIAKVGGTKDPKIEEIIALKPDLVIMDKEENRLEDFETLTSHGIHVHTLHIQTINDLDAQLQPLAEKVGAKWRPLEIGSPNQITLRAFVPIWRNPWIALGQDTYAGSLLHHLGVALVPSSGEKYPRTSLEEIKALSPQVVLAPSEPYPFTSRQLPELTQVGPVYFLDGQDLFWWGSRTQQATENIRQLLNQVLSNTFTQ